MHYIHRAGSNRNLMILLHGTGGDAGSLFELAGYIDPEASLIGIEGNISERGLKRYFARYADGSFDLDSLAEETATLKQTIDSLRTKYGSEDSRIILLGYSNGANIAVNLLREYETDYDLALLLHPSAGRAEVPFRKQDKLRVLITSGMNDPFIHEDEFLALEALMMDAGIHTQTFVHSQGHSLTQAELHHAQRAVRELK